MLLAFGDFQELCMAEGIYDRIALIKNNTTKQDRAIINFLNDNNVNNLSYLSITEFANCAKVAESTLLRFCKKLGLKGYSEFRMMLAQSMSSEYTGNSDDFAFTILSSMTTALQSTYELINQDNIEKAVTIILNAKRIYCLGSGNSGIAALEMRNKFLRFGIHVYHLNDNHFQTIATSTLGPDDALTLFSVSGSTKDMIEIAQKAKQLGTKLIIITNYLKSPLGAYADIPLYVVAKNTPLDGGSLIAKVSQLYVIDVLAAAVYKRTKDSSQRNLELTAISVFEKEI